MGLYRQPVHGMAKATQNLTPMMRQYLDIKGQHQDAILFFRLGDFYEMFFEDAEKASEVLDIALTSRNKNQESSVPLCGIPYHSAPGYIRKLIEEGLKVAICDQVEDPKLAKGIVKREVTRIITPGLLVEDESLLAAEPNYLGAFLQEGKSYHVAMVDISTGEILIGFYESVESASQALVKHRIRELLVLPDTEKSPLVEATQQGLPKLLISPLDAAERSKKDLELYSQELRDSQDQLASPWAKKVIDNLLAYVHHTQKSNMRHLGPIQVLRGQQYMSMDERTFRHLELTRNSRGEGRKGTLFWVLHQTQTAMGARRLSRWIQYPLLERLAIEDRLDGVEELMDKPEVAMEIHEKLKRVQDIERMLGKIALATVNARDLVSLGKSLQLGEELVGQVQTQLECSWIRNLLTSYPKLGKIYAEILATFQEEPPVTIREGGMITEGIHEELDELCQIRRDGKSVIAGMEEKERQRTKIPSLKIRYNKVFGYYIEVTHTHRENVPENYIRKQTLTNAERYITPELKEYENKVLGAEERIKTLEYNIFCGVRETVGGCLESIRLVGEVLGKLDAITSLARVARENRYTRPVITEDRVLDLKDSRHPVLEKLHSEERFIPNDIQMDVEANRLFLITGPNMAGKSTVMRQAAIIVLMAQMGSFVPAAQAKIGLVDQLFTRIGATDDLAQGQSTFMVEMLETANIMKSATERSFIILDEIGRGTSTYDGMSIAWAVAEHVAKKIGCRALFATHYHELIEMAAQVAGVVNFQVAVKEWNNEILFLRKLIPGGASRSYGIEVARLAGLPGSLLDRAKEVLHELENLEGTALKKLEGGAGKVPQMDLFSAPPSPVEAELKNISLDTLSPLEALSYLYKIREMIKDE